MDCDVFGPHVRSFNYFIEEGIEKAVQDMLPERFRLGTDSVEIWLEDPVVSYPSLGGEGTGRKSLASSSDAIRLYPSECRQRGLTYKASLVAKVRARVNGMDLVPVNKIIGEIPIMISSKRCHLANMNEKELVKHGEEPVEKGGYFIVNGGEKVIRFLVALRRNYPLSMIRERFKTRGKLYTQYAVLMRSVKENHTASSMTIHYMENGNMSMCFGFRQEVFYVPLLYILKACLEASDRNIFDSLMRGRESDDFWRGCVVNMFHMAQDAGVLGHECALRKLGGEFRVSLGDRCPPWFSDLEAGRLLLKLTVLVHLDDPKEKFNCLVFCAQKLMSLVRGECAEESPDNPQFQEAALSGHIMLLLTKDKLELFLSIIRRTLEAAAKKPGFSLESSRFASLLSRVGQSVLTNGLSYFLGTGNLVAKSNLGLGQRTGFVVVAERINHLRFISHFRAIHRGAPFMDMRTTDVRKLRPEAWGFICPVHTPDGGPCGLLNHLCASVDMVTHGTDPKDLIPLLEEEGMSRLGAAGAWAKVNKGDYPVYFNGTFIGYLPGTKARRAERRIRREKIRNPRMAFVEVALVTHSSDPGRVISQYGAFYVFADAGRMMRPVRNLLEQKVEQIGTFEQVYLGICLEPDELEPGVTTHQELAMNSLLSYSGNLIPYPDHNQSPRNVYECQMGKQTMGIPIHAWQYRADNKMYRIQTPHTPLVKPEAYDKYELDTYPYGTNAIIAVISYTGYDMEDAMVINKGSYERGFAHGSVYKSERVQLNEKLRGKQIEVFGMEPDKPKLYQYMDSDGLPIPRKFYQEGDPYYCTYNKESMSYKVKKYKSMEPAYLEQVKVMESGEEKDHVVLVWRLRRNPIIGDKFASRHGQKGICSFFWPVVNLPFTETGMVPDIIFNPHGYPSRMTIGMMIETMAGKAAAAHGWKQDATPFVFDEKNTAIAHFGDLLSKAGYNYLGNEVMYSGVDGRELEAQIFIGVVFYQRLRHMIADKYQVRACGPVDALTHQPVKGRKRAGGIRFGEMERDALIAHGTAAILQDRLLNCSDKDSAQMCTRCHSLISVFPDPRLSSKLGTSEDFLVDSTVRPRCALCGKTDQVSTVTVPYVLKYLLMELASVNIKLHAVLE